MLPVIKRPARMNFGRVADFSYPCSLRGAGAGYLRIIIARSRRRIGEVGVEPSLRHRIRRRNREDRNGVGRHAVLIPFSEISRMDRRYRDEKRVELRLLTLEHPKGYTV